MRIKHSFYLLFVLLLCLNTYATPKLIPDDSTISTITNKIEKQNVTCHSIISYYLDRIKCYNFTSTTHAPLNAFVSINPNALESANSLDEYFKNHSKLIGPLHCVPVVIKDNIDSIETPTSAGSFALLGSQPSKDAFLVSKLKKAGAIIIGKGGMDEFAMGASGISSRTGRVGNVYDPNKNPGGSSSGSAVAVAANFAVIGIGTDNTGSIRIPAGFNGLYGLRPSMGRVSVNGVIPLGELDGVVGPITKSTSDLAITLSVISKNDPDDPHMNSAPASINYFKALSSSAIKNKIIAVVRKVDKVSLYDTKNKEISIIFDRAIKQFKKLGATIIDIEFPDFDNYTKDNGTGGIDLLNQYLSKFPSTRNDFMDICESGRTQVMADNGHCIESHDLNSDKYKNAQKRFVKNRKYVETLMNKQHIDALLLPVSIGKAGSYDLHNIKTWQAPLSSNAGLPSLSFIVGYTNGNVKLPVSVELVSKQHMEKTLLNIVYSYEKAYHKRILPNLLPTNNSQILNMSIPELNNLITAVGVESYERVLKNGKRKDLTAEIFRDIFNAVVNSKQ